MLYHFLVPLAKDHIVFNVFRYVRNVIEHIDLQVG